MWAYGTLLVCPVLVCEVLVGNVAFARPLLLKNPPGGAPVRKPQPAV